MRRGVQRFVTSVLRANSPGFNWRGGRLVCWDGVLPQRALRVMDELKRFYGATGLPVEAEAISAHKGTEQDETQQRLDLGVTPGASGNGGRGGGFNGEGLHGWDCLPCHG